MQNLLCACLLLLTGISLVEKHGNWYYIYDETGHHTKSVPASIGSLRGFGADYFVVEKGNWYYLYDESGKRYKTLSRSIGEMVAIGSKTFVVKKGNWLATYDRDGKKISSRPVN